jgi:hypothetical protein
MLFLAALLLAQTAPELKCNVLDLTLPAAYAGWKAPGAVLAPGKAMALKAKGGAAAVTFHIASAGVYGIALDQKGWIDVYPGTAGGEALKSVSHREGDPCWSIRKIVRYQLAPGDYRLSLTKLAGTGARAMLIAGE